jgi:hypothetical protein
MTSSTTRACSPDSARSTPSVPLWTDSTSYPSGSRYSDRQLTKLGVIVDDEEMTRRGHHAGVRRISSHRYWARRVRPNSEYLRCRRRRMSRFVKGLRPPIDKS